MVLSEIDCLSFIQNEGVYPDAFFTDFETFKQHIVVKENVDVIIILAGNCHFSKRVLQEYALQLYEREKDTSDSGIRSVTILSDYVLDRLDSYYLYDTRPDMCIEVKNGKRSKKESNIWESYRSGECECAKYLEPYNSNEVAGIIKRRYDKDDELLSVIKVPKFGKR